MYGYVLMGVLICALVYWGFHIGATKLEHANTIVQRILKYDQQNDYQAMDHFFEKTKIYEYLTGYFILYMADRICHLSYQQSFANAYKEFVIKCLKVAFPSDSCKSIREYELFRITKAEEILLEDFAKKYSWSEQFMDRSSYFNSFSDERKYLNKAYALSELKKPIMQ